MYNKFVVDTQTDKGLCISSGSKIAGFTKRIQFGSKLWKSDGYDINEYDNNNNIISIDWCKFLHEFLCKNCLS